MAHYLITILLVAVFLVWTLGMAVLTAVGVWRSWRASTAEHVERWLMAQREKVRR